MDVRQKNALNEFADGGEKGYGSVIRGVTMIGIRLRYRGNERDFPGAGPVVKIEDRVGKFRDVNYAVRGKIFKVSVSYVINTRGFFSSEFGDNIVNCNGESDNGRFINGLVKEVIDCVVNIVVVLTVGSVCVGCEL